MKYILLITLFLVGCDAPPEDAVKTVRTLFTHEGCTVYKFYDNRPVYYTNCKGTSSWATTNGKVTTYYTLSSNNEN